MNDLIPFFIQHWILSSLFIIILIAIIFYEIRFQVSGFPRIDPQAVIQLINRENAIVIDIRDRAEFDQGHIIHSKHLLIADFEKNTVSLKKHKDKPIIIVSNIGQVPASLSKKMKDFKQVNILAGGIKAWQDDKLPLEKEEKSTNAKRRKTKSST